MPLHKNRTWNLFPAPGAEWLAAKLVNHSWTLCSGWSLGGYYFLNDATGEDGAFEVAVVKPSAEEGGAWWQVESITFGWLSRSLVLDQHFRETGERATPEGLALMHINKCISGSLDPGKPGNVASKIGALDVETPEQHGRCHLCA